jgi:hypothetical protein
MAFLGSIGKIFQPIVQHPLKIIPLVAAAAAPLSLLGGVAQPTNLLPSLLSAPKAEPPPQPGGPGNIEIMQSPTQPASNYYPQYTVAPQGSYLGTPYQPPPQYQQPQYYGGGSWDYSTYSQPTYQQETYYPPASTYSDSGGRPPWEDLIPLALAFL